MTKRFFIAEDGGCRYYMVAVDLDHARNMLTKAGVESEARYSSLRRAIPIAEEPSVTWTEVGVDRASKIRCNTSDDDRGRGTIPLAACDLGEWFSTEY